MLDEEADGSGGGQVALDSEGLERPPGVVAQGDPGEDPGAAPLTLMTGTTNGNLSEILSKGLTTAVDLGSDQFADGFADGRASADGVELHPLPRLGVDFDVDRAGCGPAGIAITPVGPSATGSGVGQAYADDRPTTST